MKKLSKEELIEVYQDTINKVNMLGGSNTEAIKYYQDNLAHQFIDSPKPEVTVRSIDTVSMLEVVKHDYPGRVCLLNMASYKKSGGGVKNGARAQEECLYRCSNLGVIPDEHYYPLEDNSAVYTTNAVFIKDFYYNDIIPIKSDVITIAAYNQKKDLGLKYHNNMSMEDAFYQKILFMFQLAGRHKVDILLLGAFGCGVFDNDPEFVAKVFRKVILDGNTFGVSQIIFPIINDHNSVGDNYNIFKEVLHGI